ncbi:M12 family metallo-peptidase [Flavobacterium capsici]|uniref:M12 family metallo-peptidase n=1 Tax=Flavobacterium capsici TaxID=3075618 RepID=A0AA96EWM4_9FLAO|nr:MULTISPECIES: M12 family metallo-peptidase [unclassified Flavobacterium]WNM19764.1 M12 family metallo-peptidase [Flavobacterium sp. PMR2A8]WNM21153.1 M12 family metallo-peptidase [Flavobacterium sp. PMTSA4]
MKKNLLILFVLCFSNFFAQNKIASKIDELQKENTKFTPISVLTVDTSISKTDIDKAVTNATLAKVDLSKINQIAAGQFEFIELEIPYENQNFKIQLYRVDPFAEDFRVDTDKSINIPYQKGVYYRGIINGNPNSVSAFNFFKGEFNGIFSSNELGNIVVGKIDKANNQSDYIVYSDANLKVLNDFDCHVKDDDKPYEVSTLNREVNTAKCVTFYFEIDYNLFQSNSSNTTTATNWMTSVFNNVQTLFNNDGVTTALKSIYIWTSLDPYQGVGTASSDYLEAFAQNRPVFNGDVGMLVGVDPGGLGGVAFLNSICGSINYAYSDLNGISFSTVPNYSWTVQVITHEFGHSLGSRHTHACAWNGNNTAIDGCGQQAGYSEGNCATGPIPSTTVKGTIMSYCHLISGVGISFANGFGPQPSTVIVNSVNSKSCLSTNCINTCINTVVNIQTINVTETSATITWEDLEPSVTQWQISVVPLSSAEIWNPVTQPNYPVSGLLPNTYYRITIRPVCLGITPTNRTKILATAGNYCGTMLFTDTGGIGGNYSDMESFTRVFMPNLPNQAIRIAFTAFALEDTYDFLYIYNGPNDTYPEFNGGSGYTGTNSPGTVTSTATDGSLTVKFFSDQYVTDIGWRATVSCQQSLGINSNDFIDFTYYPNPTNNSVTLKSNTTITEIDVYNIEGRKLFTKKLEALESNVDLSQFASGTYFFKVRFNEVEKNFKILKM